jgi:TIR domain
MTESDTVKQLTQIVIRGITAGNVVEIDGLGSFVPDEVLGFRFEPRQLPQVFVAYGKEDGELVRRLCDALEAVGFNPWMDERKLVPGQNWPRAIESAIETSDFFLACYSENSVSKKGGFHAEIRYALDCARRIPLDEIFIVPVRLSPCRVPRAIQRELQYVDLFPDWIDGLARLVTMLRQEVAFRAELKRY